jgi:hypothetical protein
MVVPRAELDRSPAPAVIPPGRTSRSAPLGALTQRRAAVDLDRRQRELRECDPRTRSFLAGVRNDRVRCLGVTDFGPSSSLDDACQLPSRRGVVPQAVMGPLGRSAGPGSCPCPRPGQDGS